MSRVICYVEGPSDKAAMEALLASLLSRLRLTGQTVDFFPTLAGDRKKSLLLKVPEKAVNILRNDRSATVVVLPDLYPKNRGFPHETFAELSSGLMKNFAAAAERKKVEEGELAQRFKVFCFKHDLEALLLASPERLATRLGPLPRSIRWTDPVEDQNHDRPPKQIVTELFAQSGQRYRDTVDAPLILGGMDYHTVAERCSQCFKPFVDFLEKGVVQ